MKFFLTSVFCLLTPALFPAQSVAPRYEVYAVRFAHVPYALSSLVSGAERGPQVDIAFTVWPIRDAATGRVLLVDAGFYRDKFIQSWKPQELSGTFSSFPQDWSEGIVSESIHTT